MKQTTLPQLNRDKKIAEIEKIRWDIDLDRDENRISKIYALKALLSGTMIDQEKTTLSEPVWKPMFTDDTQIIIIRNKIMAIVKQL